jgi:lipoate-protein ligase A
MAISAIEKLKSENTEKLSEEEIKTLDEEVTKLRELLAKSAPDVAELKAAAEEAAKKTYDIAAKIASANQPAESETATDSGSETKEEPEAKAADEVK